jgi:hypothetical protein
LCEDGEAKTGLDKEGERGKRGKRRRRLEVFVGF